MKHSDCVLKGLIVLFFTLLLSYDFFPVLNKLVSIPLPVVIGLMLVMVLIGLFSIREPKQHAQKSIFLWQVAFTSYLVVLILVFTMWGGVSKVGISLTSPALWLVLAVTAVTAVELFRDYKKLQAT